MASCWLEFTDLFTGRVMRDCGENLIVQRAGFVNIARLQPVDYLDAMFNLTRQQQLFLCSVLLLLLVGWAVKAWRTAHPPERATISAAP